MTSVVAVSGRTPSSPGLRQVASALPAASSRKSTTAMSRALWALIIGAVLIAMVLLGTLLERLPFSPGIIYLAIGYGVGPGGLGLLVAGPGPAFRRPGNSRRLPHRFWFTVFP